jgi:hypothetical protein
MEDIAIDPTAPTFPTATTTPIIGDIANPKAKVKKELTASKREVQNKKCPVFQIAERARKANALAAAVAEEK